MIPRLVEIELLHPRDVPPSRADFEVIGTFNPAAEVQGELVFALLPKTRRTKNGKIGVQSGRRFSGEHGHGEVQVHERADRFRDQAG